MLHLDTPLIWKVVLKYAKPSIFFLGGGVDIHSTATQILTECFDFGNISQHNRNYLMMH